MSKTTLIFSRETPLAPTLWMVVPKERAAKMYLGQEMTADLLKEMMEQAKMKEAELWPKDLLESLVRGPENREAPLELERTMEEVRPMEAEELREVLDKIEEENGVLESPSPEWDETPVERGLPE